MIFQWLIRVETWFNKKSGSLMSWLSTVNEGRSYLCHGLRDCCSFCEKEKIMSAFTFYLENSPNGPIPIKSLFFTGVAIIKSDLPIIFLIFLLILSPQCAWSALRASENRQGICNASPSRE